MVALNRNKGIPSAVAQHEVAHLLGAAIAWLGDDTGGMGHLCQHPRYHDAMAYFGYDGATGQGEFAVILSKHSTVNGAISEEAIEAVRRSSALAPIGLARDKLRILKSLKSANHMLDILNDFRDALSTEDRIHAIKGKLTIDRHEQLVGIFAYEAALIVAPNRLRGIEKLYQEFQGFDGTIPLREFISRQTATDVLAEALKMSKTLFAISEA